MTTFDGRPDTVRGMLRPRADLLAGLRPWLDRYLDIGLGVVVIAISLGTMLVAPIAIGTMPQWLAVVVTIVTGVAITLRRRWPVAVLAVVAVVILVQQAYGASLNFGSLAAVI